ncbi:MAG: hypothetical protein KKD00_01625 [Gammaproteobacteria bacterium]|nr:hypothetical protein [Gammaproteobacteria bacterium]
MSIRTIKIITSITCMFMVSPVFSQGQGGQPFQDLQNQIDDLQAQIDAMLTGNSTAPINLAVDCNNGESINSALASVGGARNQLNIEITGECIEQVILTRSNVHLQGVSADAGITGNYALFALNGASNISADSLTLDGGFAAFACLENAAMSGSNLVLENSGNGVLAHSGGACEITDSILQNNNQGMSIGTNGVVDAKGVIVQDNSGTAANVYTGGSLTLNASAAGPSLIRNNRYGLSNFANGSLRPLSVVIENNQSIGINLFSGGALVMDSYVSGGLVVQNNNGHGIIVQPLSTASFRGDVNLNNNAGMGLVCIGVHSAEGVQNILAAGNTNGDISGNCVFQPN